MTTRQTTDILSEKNRETRSQPAPMRGKLILELPAPRDVSGYSVRTQAIALRVSNDPQMDTNTCKDTKLAASPYGERDASLFTTRLKMSIVMVFP